MSFLSCDISSGWYFDYCISRIWYWWFGCLCIGMLHEMRNRLGDGYPSACSLRSAFTDWYKHARESWDVGDNKRYVALSATQLSAVRGKEEIAILRTSTTAIMMTFNPPELRMNEEFTKEMADVKIQVENKHESRIRRALSWITRKRWREVASRKRSAITSAVSRYKWMTMSMYLRFFLLTD